MKHTAILFALAIPCQAAISFSLPGNSESAAWSGLNNTNYLSTAGFPSYPTATDSWPSALTPDTGATLGGSLNKISGGGYFASASLYDAGTPGTFQITDLASLAGLETVVFQADLGSSLGAVPLLSYNGGSQALTADFTGISTGIFSSGFGGPPSPTTNHAWQWDLSGVSGSITGFAIEWTTNPHGTIYQLDLVAGDSFTQVVPEPTTSLLAALSLTLAAFRRRRA
ncbi:MAG: PEP-CTERM sorting domain-containing protein [Akkermansiaceae bacterium]|nr:PEP-CTERM sorting domain-containing protein [Akkermansiaceae bacterium]